MGEQLEQWNTLLLSATALVIAVTGLVVAIKTWWEVCKVHLLVLREARTQIKQHNKANERADISEAKAAELEAAQTVKRVDAQEAEIEYQKLTTGGGE